MFFYIFNSGELELSETWQMIPKLVFFNLIKCAANQATKFEGSLPASVIKDSHPLAVILISFLFTPRPLRRCYLKPQNLIAPQRLFFLMKKETSRKWFVMAEEKRHYMYALDIIQKIDIGLSVISLDLKFLNF